MGSMVALQIALDHPERLERVVLYGSACTGNLPDRFEPFEATIARLERLGVDACADFIVPTWFVDGEAAPYYTMCRDAGRGLHTETAIRTLRAFGEWDVCERLAEVSVPALVICGDLDRSTAPAQSYRVWRLFPTLACVSFPDARTTCIWSARSCSRASCSTFSPRGERSENHSIFDMRGASPCGRRTEPWWTGVASWLWATHPRWIPSNSIAAFRDSL